MHRRGQRIGKELLHASPDSAVLAAQVHVSHHTLTYDCVVCLCVCVCVCVCVCENGGLLKRSRCDS